MKVCERCKKQLPFELFCKNKRKKDGLNTWCKPCTKEYKRFYYEKNKEKLLDDFRGRYLKNAELRRKQENDRRNASPELYRFRAREYQKNNLQLVYERHKKWAKQKRETDLNFRIRANLRRRLNKVIKGEVKNGSAIKDLGCTVEFFISWISKKFTSQMTWENYGAVWHIDHVTPLSCFDLSIREQLLKAVHYTNLQPLLASENIRKGGANRKEYKNGNL